MAEERRNKIPSWLQQSTLSPPSPPPKSATSSHLAVDAADEEKIETFCKLIGNMIAVRELLQSSVFSGRKRKRSERELWKPTLEWEDFAGGSHGQSSVVKNGGDERRGGKDGDDKGEGEIRVDLNLRL